MVGVGNGDELVDLTSKDARGELGHSLEALVAAHLTLNGCQLAGDTPSLNTTGIRLLTYDLVLFVGGKWAGAQKVVFTEHKTEGGNVLLAIRLGGFEEPHLCARVGVATLMVLDVAMPTESNGVRERLRSHYFFFVAIFPKNVELRSGKKLI